MLSTNVSFSKFEEDIQRLMVQALESALSRLVYLPGMFAPYARREPTNIELAHAKQIIETTLRDHVIWQGTEPFIAELFKVIAQDIMYFVDTIENKEAAYKQYKDLFGIDVNFGTTTILLSLARHLDFTCFIDGEVQNNTIDCSKAVNHAIYASDADEFDFGQNDVFIIVGGVAYSFKSKHKFVWQLGKLLHNISA